jgi:hypothetical protein
VRVELPDGSYYADVGYSAPIFRAYPLFESFTIETTSERFEYDVRDSGIVVTRNPGPAKTLDPAPRALESLKPLIDAANDWSVERSFLKILAVSKHIDGVYTSLRDGLLRRYEPTGVEERMVADEELPSVLAEMFGIDPALYEQAAAVRARYMAAAG